MSETFKRILIGVVAVFVGYGFGRFEAPDRVHETVKTVEDTHAKAQVVELTAQLEELKRHTHRDVVRIVHVDGSRETHEVTDTDTDRATDIRTAKQATGESFTHSEATKEKVVERARPAWRVSALAGLDVPRAFGGTLTPVYGAELQRRLVGPLSVGVWGLSSGQAGVSLSLEF